MDTEKPDVLLLYFPYDKGFIRNEVLPVPDYQGWSIDRIEKDFMRFVEMGIDGVLVGVPIDGLAESTRPARYKEFLELLAQHTEWPDVAFFVYVNEGLDSESEDFFVKWIIELLASEPQKYMTLSGRPLVVFGPKLQWRYRHPALTVRQTAPDFAEWPMNNVKGMPGNEAVVEHLWISPVVRDSHMTSERSLMRNRDAFAFEDELRKLIRSGQSEFVTIYSWNDFSGGTFVEPNSLDKYDMSQAIYRALNR